MYQGEASCRHVHHNLPGDVGGRVAPAAEVEAQAPVWGHEGEPWKPGGQVLARRAQGWPGSTIPRSPAPPAEPAQEHPCPPPVAQPYRQRPGTAAPRSWGRGPGRCRSPGSRPSCARSGPGWAAGARLGKHKCGRNKLRMGTGAKPAPSASAGLTHCIAVQKKDAMSQTTVLHPQVEWVGAIEVGLGLGQRTARCQRGSPRDPGPPAAPLLCPEAPSWLRGLKRHPRQQSSAPSRSPGHRGGKRLLNSPEPWGHKD